MKLISQRAAANLLGVSPQRITNMLNERPLRKFFVLQNNGIYKINAESKSWKQQLTRSKNERKLSGRESTAQTAAAGKSKNIKTVNDEDEELINLAGKAKLRRMIHMADIKEQQAMQERMKTDEQKRNLAPIDLIKYFFSFGENLISRLYRRPHEISPKLSAFYLAGEDKKAVQFLRRELEAIVVDVQMQMIQEIEDEGYKKTAKKVKENISVMLNDEAENDSENDAAEKEAEIKK